MINIIIIIKHLYPAQCETTDHEGTVTMNRRNKNSEVLVIVIIETK